MSVLPRHEIPYVSPTLIYVVELCENNRSASFTLCFCLIALGLILLVK